MSLFYSIIWTAGRGAFHEAIARLKLKYGDLFAIQLGRGRVTVVSCTDYIRHILTDRNTYEISETTNRNFKLIFPTALLAIRGDDFKRHSRIMLPMYRKNKTLPFFDKIVLCIDRFVEKEFSCQDRRIHTDLVVKCQHVLLNIIAIIGFDYDLEIGSPMDGDALRRAFNDVIKCANHFALMAGMPLWIARMRLAIDFKFQRALRILQHYVICIIDKEQKRQRDEQQTLTKPKSLIASMVTAAENDRLEMGSSKALLSTSELFDEVSLSMVAGFETTSTALSWFFFLMSKHLDVQVKIKEELHYHGLTPSATITPDDLDALVYVECVMKELLRYAPIAAAIVRQATRDDIINDIIVRKGDIFLIATQNMHRDPRYWKIDPTKFIPERFLDEDKHPPPYAYMPFGGGHRACIGQDLALFELKIAIARLMQRITIEDAGNEANNSGGFIQRITCFPKHVAVRVYMDSNTNLTT
ncbi:unnamed protein product [Rotaria magnacalcarata]|uniref:Cytochrome P450 n=2 Tax=Rotaria magnacalcarata TaxID=392030 RepID=A0A819RKW4_9BILA|nr:unnamed protein product [Rotaria magnacalcarata]CAF2134524.1 unnamed protein product [Rotaria magnacalcarata]CAF3926344.1 unnamed protein product [Rotaria magnacalcarata]CAF4041549.1 unnamed protein product [Rotaria magnacalcarata]CAF4049555.1 unnamed protein product [Rotaria magnacalcarata]